MLAILLVVLLLSFALSFRATGTSWIAAARRSFAWAALGGVTGFVLGFFGPMIVAPDAAQGPMVGVFLTAPAGFALGLLAGIVREVRARRRDPEPL